MALTSHGLLKFAGVAAAGGNPLVQSFLADWGTGQGAGAVLTISPAYAVALPMITRNITANLPGGFVVPPMSQISINFRKNGFPAFSITYGPGESGIKTTIAGPLPFAIGDTFDVQVLSSVAQPVDVSVTVGVE